MFGVFRHLKGFFRERRLTYMLSFAAIAVDYLMQLVVPWVVGYVTDLITQGTLNRQNFRLSMVIMLVTSLISYGATFFWSYQAFSNANILVRNTRVNMLSKFLRQSPLFYSKHTNATLLTRTMSDVESLETFAGYGIMCLVDSTVYPLTIIIMMGFLTSWPLTLVSIIPILLILPIYLVMSKKIYRLYDEQQESYEALYSQVLENMSAVRLTRAYRMELKVEADFNKAVQNTYEKTMSVSRLDALFAPINRLFSSLALVTALTYGGYLMGQNVITLGNLVSFTIYLGFLVWPMLAFGDFVNFTQQASASMERIQELLGYKEEFSYSEDRPIYPGHGDLHASDYSFRYPDAAEPALADLNFSIDAGKTLGIVGKTGAGKSTLVRQLMHLYPQDLLAEGDLKLGGQPVEDWEVKSLRNCVGYVPQDHFLFSDTIAENVRFGDPEATDDEVSEALDFADFWKDLTYLSDGIETMVGEKGVTLSGGQKQRLAIARAVLRDPDILILDDSLSAVDAQTEKRILDHIRERREGRSTVITAHRLTAVQHAELILVMDRGRIADQGTHDELMGRSGWYAEQYLHQSEGEQDNA